MQNSLAEYLSIVYFLFQLHAWHHQLLCRFLACALLPQFHSTGLLLIRRRFLRKYIHQYLPQNLPPPQPRLDISRRICQKYISEKLAPKLHSYIPKHPDYHAVHMQHPISAFQIQYSLYFYPPFTLYSFFNRSTITSFFTICIDNYTNRFP